MSKYEKNQIDIAKLDEKINQLINLNKALDSKIDLIKEISINANADLDMNFCPICNELTTFKSFHRERALCPHCGSLERHRLIYLVFQQFYYQKFNQNIKLLHFAPERTFYNIFSQKENIDYFPVDFSPEVFESRGLSIRFKVDIQDLPFPDENFDIIYNSHVLEHVPNDHQAMEELYRVLKPNGVCFVMVPIFNIPKTFEEEANTPELRLKLYGQEDHLRNYGNDFKDRLVDVGFNVKEIKANDICHSSLKRKFYGLPSSSVFVCTK